MGTKSTKLLSWVESEVRKCRPIALRYFCASSLSVTRKKDGSPVTDADRAIEERLRRSFKRAFPGESILGEEFGASGYNRSDYWTIDPIDGTRAFSRGLPSWGIMVGRVENGRPALGVVDYPVVNTTITGWASGSAHERNGSGLRRLARAKPVGALRDSVVFHGGSNWWQGTGYEQGFARLVKSCFLERAYGDCYGYLWLLRGFADVVLDYGVKPWDVVPLAALAQATGRIMTDFSGREHFTGPETVMAHPTFARQVCGLLRSRGRGRSR